MMPCTNKIKYPKIMAKMSFILLAIAFWSFLFMGEAYAQVGGATIKANFGVDADIYADTSQFGSIAGPNSTDDWFDRKPGLGVGVIDTTGGGAFRALISAGGADANRTFVRRQVYPQNTIIGGKLLFDAVYARDNHSVGGSNDSTVFTATADKNIDNPRTWNLGTAGTPRKDDIVDAWAHLRFDGTSASDSLWLFVGISTMETDGDKHTDYAFFKNNVEYDGVSLTNLGPDSGRTAWRAPGGVLDPGDFIFAVNFTGGGSTPSATIRLWVDPADTSAIRVASGNKIRFTGVFDGGGTDAGPYGFAEAFLPPGATFARVNVEEPTLGTPWGSLEGPGADFENDMLSLQFAEAGVNLTAIGLGPEPGGDPCENLFGSIMFKSRSSASFVSEQKDFVGPFPFGRVEEVDFQLTTTTITCLNPIATTSAINVTPTTGISYLWSGTGYVSGQGTATATWNQGGYKKLTVTIIASGCAKTDSILVPVDITPPTLVCGPPDSLTCVKLTATTTVSSTPSVGVTYVWSGAGYVSGQGTATATWNAPGLKKVVVTRLDNGCKDSCTVNITQNITPPTFALQGDSLTCVKTTATTSVTSVVPAGVTYLWSGTGLSGSATGTSATWTAPGYKKVTVTRIDNGCAHTDSVLVTQNIAIPILVCGPPDSLTCVKLTATTTVSSTPSVGVTYVWSGAGYVSGQGTATATWNAPGLKKVVVTRIDNGCKDSCTVNVTQSITPPTFALQGDSLTCIKTTATTTVTSVTPPGVTYLWSGTGLSGSATGASATWTAPGYKKVTVTRIDNGCAHTDSVLVTQNIALPILVCGPPDSLTCVKLTATTTVSSTPSVGVTYGWSGAGYVSGQGTATATWNAPGLKKVVVTRIDNGCKDSCTVNVTQNITPPTFALVGDSLTCVKTTATTSVISVVPAGVTYLWSGTGLSGSATGASADWTAPGYKTVVVTRIDNGCTNTDSVEVTENVTQPSCSLTAPDPLPACGSTGNVLTASSTNTDVYLWSVSGAGWLITAGQGTNSITYNAGSGSATFKLIVTNSASGCVDSCEVTFECTSEDEFCSLTQGFYGNEGGITCDGYTTSGLLSYLLSSGNLVLGLPGYSFTITQADTNCVIMRLPAGGPSKMLPAGNGVFGGSCLPTTAIPMKKGKFANTLLGQAIALGLNLRLDSDLGNLVLADMWMTTAKADYVNGICGDGDDVIMSPGGDTLSFYIPSSVLSALTSLYGPGSETVANLFVLANNALGGGATGGASLGDITKALGAINDGFDECRFLLGFSSTQPVFAKAGLKGDSEELPTEYDLGVNYPNPFNPVTVIEYALPEASYVVLTVYNILGQQVATLVNEQLEAGYYSATWNATNTTGSSLSSGIYIYRVSATSSETGKEFIKVRKMILMK